MWPITVVDTGPSLSLDDLSAAENRLGEPIPAVYREFLLTYNGGRPYPNGFTVPAAESELPRETRLEWLLGITGGIVADNDLEEHYELVKPHLPDLFPIAWDREAKLVLIGIADEWTRDAIYYCDKEIWLAQGAASLHDHVLFLARDFFSFLRGLR
jgi:hypothetical protein